MSIARQTAIVFGPKPVACDDPFHSPSRVAFEANVTASGWWTCPLRGFGALGYRAKGYRWVRSNGVRVKNRLKSLYRSRGVPVGGGEGSATKRGEYLDRLPKPAQPLAELLCQELDALDGLKSEAKRAMLAEAKRHAEFRLVRSRPGLGRAGVLAVQQPEMG